MPKRLVKERIPQASKTTPSWWQMMKRLERHREWTSLKNTPLEFPGVMALVRLRKRGGSLAAALPPNFCRKLNITKEQILKALLGHQGIRLSVWHGETDWTLLKNTRRESPGVMEAVRVRKWGGSLMVALPPNLCRKLPLLPGQILEARLAHQGILLTVWHGENFWREIACRVKEERRLNLLKREKLDSLVRRQLPSNPLNIPRKADLGAQPNEQKMSYKIYIILVTVASIAVTLILLTTLTTLAPGF